MAAKIKVAIIGSGNIGTDLMIKVMHIPSTWKWARWLASIPTPMDSPGRSRMGVDTTDKGIDGLVETPVWKEIRIVFDATSAGTTTHNERLCNAHGKQMIDLTPAAIGPYTIPLVNLTPISTSRTSTW